MVTNFKRMDEIRRILQCYGNCGSFKETARKMQVSRNTVKKYVHVCRDRQISLFQISQLNDEQLKSLFYVPETAKEYTRQEYFESRVEYWVGELRRKGVTRHLLWEEYLEQTPDGFKYAQYCDRLRQYIKRTDLTLAMEHTAGEKAMIDYAGSKVPWYDPETGEKRWAEVLVVVLPNSQYTFAIALSSQKLPDFIYGLNKALEYFGGVPKILLSDNLRAYVKRLDRYEPSFTDMSVQLAAHYNVELQATRVARPKDKGSVENAVSTTYKRLYAPLRNRTFYSINQINEAFKQQLIIHNCTPYQKKSGCRKSVFDTYEKPVLNALPATPFEIKKMTRAKIQNNYHAFLGEEKNYYSVHYKYVGKKVELVYTDKIVEIYYKGRRIALHKRLNSRNTFKYSTREDHKPRAHQIYEKIKSYDDAHFIEQAKKIGTNTSWAINYILKKSPNKEQALKSCLGVLRLSRNYSYDRLENACHRCKGVGHVNYKMIQNILIKKLDIKHDHTQTTIPITDHQNIRGAKAYQ